MNFRALPALTRTLAALLLAATVALPPVVARGQEAHQDTGLPAKPEPKQPTEQKIIGKGALQLLPANAVTRHEIATDSGTINYTATAGTLALHDQSGERVAAVFYVSYVADKPTSIKRPVTFVFNGGPGAASAYLHLGLAGPRLAEFRAGREGPPLLHDNPQTWLQFTDLVMIDPVGSGFSRPATRSGAWRATPSPCPR
jgi:carboxypeptidase C (cathepsin A)